MKANLNCINIHLQLQYPPATNASHTFGNERSACFVSGRGNTRQVLGRKTEINVFKFRFERNCSQLEDITDRER